MPAPEHDHLARFRQRVEVEHTPELARIAKLPKVEFDAATQATLAADMTEALKTERGTMALRPIQAMALYSIMAYGGMFGPIGVGRGKTIISLLAPTVLGATKPMLILPASLVQKTKNEWMVGTATQKALAHHWRISNNIRIVSYESLGRVSGLDELKVYKPDLIIFDEAHKAKNRKAAVTKRLVRYMNEFPDTKVVAMSGTIMTKSLRDFSHLVRWSLKGNSPIPKYEGELGLWADAIDENVPALQRVHCGALKSLASNEDIRTSENTLQLARKAFRTRLVATPGVVASTGDSVTSSLRVSALEYELDDITEGHFDLLRRTWTTPSGWTFGEAAELWMYARQLALGVNYKWDPFAPDDWRTARKEWAKFVRKTTKESHHLDSELQVAMACEKGQLRDIEYRQWMRLKPTFSPNTVADWHDSGALDTCAKWAKDGPGIIWTEHSLFAIELARRTGLPYYGAKGVDRKTGLFIEQSDPKKALIASVAANSTGKNLQAWNRNLLTSPPSGSDLLEQTIGRTHREGQTSDEVIVDVLLGCREHFDSIHKAMAGARMVRDALGQPQKILIADVLWPDEPEYLSNHDGPRWNKEVDDPIEKTIWSS